MDPSPISHDPPQAEPGAVERAQQVLEHLIALEASPAWKWQRQLLEQRRDKLSEAVLDDDRLDAAQRERTRIQYKTLKQIFLDMEQQLQDACDTLHRAGKLPSAIYSSGRYTPPATPAAPFVDTDAANPFDSSFSPLNEFLKPVENQ